MSMTRCLITGLCCALLAPTAIFAEESDPQATGLRPSTAEEQAWEAANVITTRAVRPTATARNRFIAERIRKGSLVSKTAAAAPAVAADGEEIEGASAMGNLRVSAASLAPVLPVAVDNSTEIWFPPVRNQGSLGSCVFFSQTYYTMSYLVNRSLNRDGRDPADNNTKMSPRFTYNIDNNGLDSGAGITAGFSVMTSFGALTWAEFPYTNDYKTLPTTAAAWRSALRHRIGQIGRIDGIGTDVGRAMAKQMLANGYLINYGTFIDSWKGLGMQTLRDNPASSLDDGIVGHKVAIFSYKGGGAHAMTIVGYNDDAWADVNGNGRVDDGELGAFKVVNSWGTGWGTGGFCWVAYDAIGNVSMVAGANQPARSNNSLIFSVYWAKLRQDSKPSVVAEIDITTSKRNDLNYLSNVGSTTEITRPSSGNRSPSSFSGNLSFAGTTAAGDATIALDVSDLADGGLYRRWFLQVKGQSTITKSSTIRGFRLTDGDGKVLGSATGTNPAGGFPKTISPSGADLTTWIDLQIPDPAVPAVITDLTVVGTSPTSVTLAFSATGDDGTQGYAASYDLRRSTSMITADNIGAATARTITPVGLVPAGATQQVTVDDLTPGATFFFAVRGVDDAGKRSPLSNVVQVSLPTTLTVGGTLPTAMVGKAYSASIGATGGTAPRVWALTPTMTETTGGGGTLIAGTRYDVGNVAYALPFAFPIQFPIGVQYTRSVRINRNDASLSFPETYSYVGTFLRSVDHAPYKRRMEFTGTGEGVFIDATTERVVVRWKGHPLGVTGKDGSLEVQSTLFPDGSVTFAYGAIDESATSNREPATIGIVKSAIDDDSLMWPSVRNRAATIPAGATSRWTPTRLPPGLSLHPTTGVISGTPTTAGTWTVPITITDSGVPAQRVAITATITVQAGSLTNQPPVVTVPPTVAQGVMVLP